VAASLEALPGGMLVSRRPPKETVFGWSATALLPAISAAPAAVTLPRDLAARLGNTGSLVRLSRLLLAGSSRSVGGLESLQRAGEGAEFLDRQFLGPDRRHDTRCVEQPLGWYAERAQAGAQHFPALSEGRRRDPFERR